MGNPAGSSHRVVALGSPNGSPSGPSYAAIPLDSPTGRSRCPTLLPVLFFARLLILRAFAVFHLLRPRSQFVLRSLFLPSFPLVSSMAFISCFLPFPASLFAVILALHFSPSFPLVSSMAFISSPLALLYSFSYRPFPLFGSRRAVGRGSRALWPGATRRAPGPSWPRGPFGSVRSPYLCAPGGPPAAAPLGPLAQRPPPGP